MYLNYVTPISFYLTGQKSCKSYKSFIQEIIDINTEKTESDSDPDFQEPSKQEKYQFNSSIPDDQSDNIPFCFRHI